MKRISRDKVVKRAQELIEEYVAASARAYIAGRLSEAVCETSKLEAIVELCSKLGIEESDFSFSDEAV